MYQATCSTKHPFSINNQTILFQIMLCKLVCKPSFTIWKKNKSIKWGHVKRVHTRSCYIRRCCVLSSVGCFLSQRKHLMSYKPFRGLTLALSILLDLITSDNKPSYYLNKLPCCLTNDDQMNRSDSVGVFVRAPHWPVGHSNHIHMGDESSAETFKIKLMVIDKEVLVLGLPWESNLTKWNKCQYANVSEEFLHSEMPKQYENDQSPLVPVSFGLWTTDRHSLDTARSLQPPDKLNSILRSSCQMTERATNGNQIFLSPPTPISSCTPHCCIHMH